MSESPLRCHHRHLHARSHSLSPGGPTEGGRRMVIPIGPPAAYQSLRLEKQADGGVKR